MYLAGVSTRRIEDVSGILWDAGMSAGTVSNLIEKACKSVDEWRCQPLTYEYPYVYIDGVHLMRSRGCSYENVAVMVVICVNRDGYREVSAAKAGSVAAKLESMKVKEAAEVVREGFAEMLTYCEMPHEH